MPEIKIDQYTTLQINIYKDTYSLVEGWIDRNNNFKPNFCRREFGKVGEKVEKIAPVSIKCGDKESVKKLALFLLESIGESDLPF